MAKRRVQKEVADVNKLLPQADYDSPYYGITLEQKPDSDGCFHVHLHFQNSIYQRGTIYASIPVITLAIRFPADYPFKPFKLRFIPNLPHPNLTQAYGDTCRHCCSPVAAEHEWSPRLTFFAFALDAMRLLAHPEGYPAECPHDKEHKVFCYQNNNLPSDVFDAMDRPLSEEKRRANQVNREYKIHKWLLANGYSVQRMWRTADHAIFPVDFRAAVRAVLGLTCLARDDALRTAALTDNNAPPAPKAPPRRGARASERRDDNNGGERTSVEELLNCWASLPTEILYVFLTALWAASASAPRRLVPAAPAAADAAVAVTRGASEVGGGAGAKAGATTTATNTGEAGNERDAGTMATKTAAVAKPAAKAGAGAGAKKKPKGAKRKNSAYD